jgi:hypothetical protein
MSENEWLASSDAEAMLYMCHGGRVKSDLDRCRLARKLRLFAAACCRQIWHWLPDSRSQYAVEVAERFADGLATAEELKASADSARLRVDEVVTIRDGEQWLDSDIGQAAEAAVSVTHIAASFAASGTLLNARDALLVEGTHVNLDWEHLDPQRLAAAERPYVHLLREIFGNPFRPVEIDRSRLTLEITGLVLASYKNRSLRSGELDPVRLSILAEALEEAGGFPSAILDHLRSPGSHVRGCWAIDSLRSLAGERHTTLTMTNVLLKTQPIKDVRRTSELVDITLLDGSVARLDRNHPQFEILIIYIANELRHNRPIGVALNPSGNVIDIGAALVTAVYSVRPFPNDPNRFEVGFLVSSPVCGLTRDQPDFERIHATLTEAVKTKQIVWVVTHSQETVEGEPDEDGLIPAYPRIMDVRPA